MLSAVTGVSGSGKTSQSQPLVEACGVIRVRADVERKRLFGLDADARSGSTLGGGLYSAQASARTYARLAELARAVVEAGYPVLVDATFIRREPRERMRAVATAMQVPCFVLAFTALFDAGARVGLGEPGYPSYRQILRALSLTPVGIPSSAANRLQPVPADLDGVEMQGLIVASPGNPTGTMLSHASLKALMDHAAARDIAIVMSPNFSVGVNVAFRLLAIAAEALGKGYDVDLVRAVCAAVTIPVVATGGLGTPAHVVDLVEGTEASAAASAPTPCWPACRISAATTCAGTCAPPWPGPRCPRRA